MRRRRRLYITNSFLIAYRRFHSSLRVLLRRLELLIFLITFSTDEFLSKKLKLSERPATIGLSEFNAPYLITQRYIPFIQCERNLNERLNKELFLPRIEFT